MQTKIVAIAVLVLASSLWFDTAARSQDAGTQPQTDIPQSRSVVGIPSYCFPKSPCVYCVTSDSEGNCHECRRRRYPAYCRHVRIQRTQAAGLTGDQFAILNAHKDYRAKHCVPTMSWSQSLASAAEAYAKQCKYEKDAQGKFKSFTHDSGRGSVGENMYAAWGSGSGNARASVDSWYSEIKNYNFGNPVYTTSPQVGHFTQVVWKTSTQVGCGTATCNIDGKAWVRWVCRYAPAGNVNVGVQKSLRDNVLPVCK